MCWFSSNHFCSRYNDYKISHWLIIMNDKLDSLRQVSVVWCAFHVWNTSKLVFSRRYKRISYILACVLIETGRLLQLKFGVVVVGVGVGIDVHIPLCIWACLWVFSYLITFSFDDTVRVNYWCVYYAGMDGSDKIGDKHTVQTNDCCLFFLILCTNTLV